MSSDRSKTRRSRPKPTDFEIFTGSHTKGSTSRTSFEEIRKLKSGKTKTKGWGVELSVPHPWMIRIDARELGAMAADKMLAVAQRNIRAGKLSDGTPLRPGWEELHRRGIATDVDANFMADRLRRTFLPARGKGNRWNKQKRARAVLLYFAFGGTPPGPSEHRNPSAAANQLIRYRKRPGNLRGWFPPGQELLSLGGPMSRAMQEGLDEWADATLEGIGSIPEDTPARARGKG